MVKVLNGSRWVSTTKLGRMVDQYQHARVTEIANLTGPLPIMVGERLESFPQEKFSGILEISKCHQCMSHN